MRIAVLIPCYNEELTIGLMIASFRAVLPGAEIFVYDNNSTDGTAAAARAAGVGPRLETLPGQGHVVRRMFAAVEADVYILVDGDGTYDVPGARFLLSRLIADRLDMVVGRRVSAEGSGAYRAGHAFGNRLLTGAVSLAFGARFTDMLSGYRALSRRFVKSFPSLSQGFEIETELTVHALSLHLPAAEVDTLYYARPEGSTSKLNTYRDGLRILLTIVKLLKEERPFAFFSAVAALLLGAALILAAPLLATYLQTGLVPRLPTAVAATGLTILASLSFACAVVLDSVRHGRRELRRLFYLREAAPAGDLAAATKPTSARARP